MGDRQKRKRCQEYQNERNSYAKMILVSQAISMHRRCPKWTI